MVTIYRLSKKKSPRSDASGASHHSFTLSAGIMRQVRLVRLVRLVRIVVL